MGGDKIDNQQLLYMEKSVETGDLTEEDLETFSFGSNRKFWLSDYLQQSRTAPLFFGFFHEKTYFVLSLFLQALVLTCLLDLGQKHTGCLVAFEFQRNYECYNAFMWYLGPNYTNRLVVIYLKFKFYLESCVLSGISNHVKLSEIYCTSTG